MMYGFCTVLMFSGILLSVHGKTFYLSDLCGRDLNMRQRKLNDFELNLTKYRTYWSDVSCQMDIVTYPDHRLSFKILKINLNDCNDNLFLYGDSKNSSDALYAHKCSTHTGVYTTPSSKGIVTFKSNAFANKGGFSILITTFQDAVKNRCQSGYFMCANKRCIDSDLVCNRRDNCGDNSDEKDKERCKKQDVGAIVGPCIGVGILLFFLFINRKKIKERLCRKNAAQVKTPSTSGTAKVTKATPVKKSSTDETTKTAAATKPTPAKKANAEKSTKTDIGKKSTSTNNGSTPEIIKSTPLQESENGCGKKVSGTTQAQRRQADAVEPTTERQQSTTVTLTSASPKPTLPSEDTKANPQSSVQKSEANKAQQSTDASQSTDQHHITNWAAYPDIREMANAASQSSSLPLLMPIVPPIHVHVHPIVLPPIETSLSSALPNDPPPPYVTLATPQLPLSAYRPNLLFQTPDPSFGNHQEGQISVTIPLEGANSQQGTNDSVV